MNKEEKSATVAQLAEDFDRASIALLSEYRGMSAGESDDMRRRIRAVSGEFRVTKNTLLRLAIKDTRYASLDGHLGGPIGLILSYADPVELAKTVSSFKDLGEKFKLRGGVLDGKALTAAEINELASLPPREVILSQLLGLIQAPASQLVRLLNEPGSVVARLIDAIGRKRGEAAPAVAEASAPEAPVAEAAPASEASAAEAPAADADPSETPQS
ncbi:MAG: 50S ribosomal protein L10 [Deltaproteobacteria bacterium]|nr:50S ribosomal protein L10 [Deltaproteobacteria bacterium]